MTGKKSLLVVREKRRRGPYGVSRAGFLYSICVSFYAASIGKFVIVYQNPAAAINVKGRIVFFSSAFGPQIILKAEKLKKSAKKTAMIRVIMPGKI